MPAIEELEAQILLQFKLLDALLQLAVKYAPHDEIVKLKASFPPERKDDANQDR